MYIKSKGNFINGEWKNTLGEKFTSYSPINRELLWNGNKSTNDDVNLAVESAKDAFRIWSELEVKDRIKYLQSYVDILKESKEELSKAIAYEVGKPLWEAVTEVNSMIGKLEPSIEAFELRNKTIIREQGDGTKSVTKFKPHGVVAIIGPYNFPGHMPNGHIIAALLAGNTVVLKPSEKVPFVSEKIMELWERANLPKGVINMVQGDKDTGESLCLNSNVNGVFFTGSKKAGQRIEIKEFDYTNSGVFIARINKDSNDLAELFDDLTDDISVVLLNISFVIYSYFVNIYLGMTLTINIIVLYILISRKLIYFKRYQKDYKRKDDKCVGTYSDVIRGIRDIKNLNLKDSIVSRVSVEQKEAIEANKRVTHSSRTWNRFRDIAQHIFNFLFVLISIYLLSINMLKLNQFMILFVYKKNIIQLIKSITNIREKVANAQVAADRVFGIIDYKEFDKEEFGNVNIKNIRGTVEFKNVTFSYNKENELFDKLNFYIEENKMTALVGKSGEGKSTIIDLIMKNYDINEGKILIGDYEISRLTENTIRDNISIVSQEPYIFNLTIKDNIRLVNPKASEEEIIDVCKKAQIHNFIMSKKDGYDTYIGENGITLSGGQKQRLAIARALIKKSKIILLDEATSSLDNESQEKIKQSMKELTTDHTVIIVAHRLSTIVDADKILVFNNHKIVEEGTHEELMENSNVYRKLYEKDNINQEIIE